MTRIDWKTLKAVNDAGGAEVLILDPAVAHAESLLAGLRPGIEVLRLAAGGRGIEQIAERLSGRYGIAALHVVSHGEPGLLLLAGERVDLPALALRHASVTRLAAALAPDAAVLLYGCSIASGPAGRRLLEYLEVAFGVPVAASAGPVGDGALGGSWSFARPGGGLPVRPAFSAEACAAYPALLAPAVLTIGADSPAMSAGDDTVAADTAGTLNAGDSIDGLGGSDTLVISAAQSVTLGAATLVNVETVTITAGIQTITTHDATVATGQTLTVNAAANPSAVYWSGSAERDGRFVLIGGEAADTLIGGDGADTLSGNVGADHLSGGAGDDVFSYDNQSGTGDVIVGGAGTDVIRIATYADFLGVGSITGIEALAVTGGATAVFVDVFDGSSVALSGQGTFSFMVLSGTALDLSGFDASALTAGDCTVSLAAGDDDGAVLTGLAGFGTRIFGQGGNDLLRGGAQADFLTAGAGEDTLSGGGGDDTLSGGDGNDVLSGGAGSDTLSGQNGHDVLHGGGDCDFLTGGTGNDTLSGGGCDDLLSGGDGDDLLDGGAGDDDLCGEDGRDLLRGGAGVDRLCGAAGDDTLAGGDQADLLVGESGADLLSGGGGDDVLSGGAGVDTLSGGTGTDVFVIDDADVVADWGAGEELVVLGAAGLTDAGILRAGDQLSLDTDGDNTADLVLTTTGIAGGAVFAVTVDGGHAHLTYSVPGGSGGGGGGGDGGGDPPPSTAPPDIVVVDTASGAGTGNRTISNTGSAPGSAALVENTGNNGNLVTASLPAGTTLVAEGPSVAQSGSDALSTLVGAIDSRDPSGEATLIASARDYLSTLGDGTTLDVRTIVATAGGTALSAPIVISGNATDGTPQAEAFVIDVTALPAGSTLQLENIEFASIVGSATVTGGSGDNYAVGDDNAQFISLGAGDDTLHGGGGDDSVGSADGEDRLHGDGGDDSVFGGTGGDSVSGGDDQDVLYGNQGADLLYGNPGLDTLYGGQDGDRLYGGQHQDRLYGNLGDDVLYGNLGGDTLYGGQGHDLLYGGSNDGSYGDSGASDVLYGNQGDDTLVGGQGDDVLYGGDGADLFVFAAGAGHDTIADFDGEGGDRVAFAADTGIDGLADLLASLSVTADGSAAFSFDGDMLVLSGVAAADLQSGWFGVE